MEVRLGWLASSNGGLKPIYQMYTRHADGHVMMDYPNRAIEILSTA